jgi:hypothetical protein
MAKALPIEITNLISRGLADDERFFRLLSEFNNYVGPEYVKTFYKGLIEMIKQELRANGAIRLPDLMDIALVSEKPHLNLMHAGKIPQMQTVTHVLKAFPKEKLRDYFREKDKKIQIGYTPTNTLDEYGVETE